MSLGDYLMFLGRAVTIVQITVGYMMEHLFLVWLAGFLFGYTVGVWRRIS